GLLHQHELVHAPAHRPATTVDDDPWPCARRRSGDVPRPVENHGDEQLGAYAHRALDPVRHALASWRGAPPLAAVPLELSATPAAPAGTGQSRRGRADRDVRRLHRPDGGEVEVAGP